MLKVELTKWDVGPKKEAFYTEQTACAGERLHAGHGCGNTVCSWPNWPLLMQMNYFLNAWCMYVCMFKYICIYSSTEVHAHVCAFVWKPRGNVKCFSSVTLHLLTMADSHQTWSSPVQSVQPISLAPNPNQLCLLVPKAGDQEASSHT